MTSMNLLRYEDTGLHHASEQQVPKGMISDRLQKAPGAVLRSVNGDFMNHQTTHYIKRRWASEQTA